MKQDIHQTITDRLIATIEAGPADFGPRWFKQAFREPLRITGQPYRGINWLMLASEQEGRGFESCQWMTFKQAKDLGGAVRKGEHGTPITFAKPINNDANDAEASDGDTKARGGCILRGYYVFNVDQIDGLPAKYATSAANFPTDPKERDEAAEAALRSSGATIIEGGSKAYFHPRLDVIHLPSFEAFYSTGGYLATLAHELVHWTGHESREARPSLKNYGENIETRALEELVAEIGAAFVCARLGIAGDHFEDHASYVSSWLQALKNDKRHIFKAASLAQRAADIVLANAGQGEAPSIAAPLPVFVPQPAFIPTPAPAAQMSFL
jgi:antirestriction protein ArdC